jgi:SH3 domain-containing YSC84-like protein 1
LNKQLPQLYSGETEDTIMKRRMPILLVTLLTLTCILPAWGGDKTKDEETLRNAANVLQTMISEGSVQQSLIEKAECVVVLPDVKKFGLGIGGTGGRGPMSCRTSAGKWSDPVMYSIGGLSAGLQIGGSSSDIVLLVMSEKGKDALLKGETKMGADATAAAGPGATAKGTPDSDILTYARSGGLFAGASLGGASLKPDNDANERLYGKGVSAKNIVAGNVAMPPGGETFLATLGKTAAATTK